MEPTDITIEILRGIQATLVSIDGRLADHGERLAALDGHAAGTNERLGALERHAVPMERHAAATNEILGIMNEQLTFFGCASTAAAEARSRLDDRMDAIEQRLEAVERKVPG